MALFKTFCKKIIALEQVCGYGFYLLLGFFHLDLFWSFKILYDELRGGGLMLFIIEIRVSVGEVK